MYPEFIAIYVGLGILAAMLAAVIALLFILIRKISSSHSVRANNIPAQRQNDTINQSGASFNVAFCNNCGTKYDAQTRVCPKCGTPR